MVVKEFDVSLLKWSAAMQIAEWPPFNFLGTSTWLRHVKTVYTEKTATFNNISQCKMLLFF